MLRAAARLATGRNMLQAFSELFHGARLLDSIGPNMTSMPAARLVWVARNMA
jgi:hypothetical protein